MSEMIELSGEHYHSLARAAAARGQTPQTLLAEIIEDLDVDPAPRAYETEEWFRHLGATEDQIAEAKRIAQARSAVGDAHA